MGLTDYYRRLVRPLVEGRKLILAGTPLAAAPGAARAYLDLGAAGVFIVANGLGTGDLPSKNDATWVVLDINASSVMDEFRQTRAALGNLPRDAREALDAWDPDQEAVLLGDPFYTDAVFADRAVYGNRRPEWEALEDKIIVDALWDEAGIRRAPARVVPADRIELQKATAALNWGLGTAWAGDAREGFNGGVEYIRWIRHPEDLDEALGFYGDHCDRVRVMPFLEGVPCSIHGMVFPETVIALRPCEMLTLRPNSGNRLRYGGSATFWDPPEPDREEMRDIARKVGSHLDKTVGFRGGFTVDGVLTEVGFLPTELNTRPGGARSAMLGGLADLPIGMIQRAIIEEEDFDFRATELENLIVESADARRGGGALTVAAGRMDESVTLGVRFDDGIFTPTEDAESADAKLLHGPHTAGSLVLFVPEPGKTPAGPSLAPRAVAALALADELWNTGIGPLQPAKSVR